MLVMDAMAYGRFDFPVTVYSLFNKIAKADPFSLPRILWSVLVMKTWNQRLHLFNQHDGTLCKNPHLVTDGPPALNRVIGLNLV